MQTTQLKTGQIEKSNDLRHRIITQDKEGNAIYIQIRLNDECKNGHQDFSITADIYQSGKPRNDKYFMGGCCHEEILKVAPDLKIFVALHLCDYKGIPMHAAANGFYHLKNGFNTIKPEDEQFMDEYCEYYRISTAQFEKLNKCYNEIQFSLALKNLGILKQWENEAKKAIEILEEMTGKVFQIDSKRTQYISPTPAQIKEEQEKQKNGYYTPEAEQKRELEKMDMLISGLEAERDKGIEKYNTEFEVKKQILIAGGKKALDNCIFYDHKNQISFNWRSYDQISSELVNKIIATAQLPKGITITNEKGRNS